MTGEYELLKKVLSTIEVKEGLNKDNIIEEIQEELKEQDQGLYQEWEKGKFDVNHVFSLYEKLTLLMIAANNGHANVVKVLLEKGAHVNEKDWLGRTPLHLAVWGDHASVVEVLLAKGANVNAVNKDGQTPLYCACYNVHVDVNIINALTAAGANVNAVDRDERTSLDYAESKNVKKAMKALSDLKARNKSMIAGGVTTLLGTAIAVALFTTGIIAAQLIPIVISVVAIAAAALVVGCATYALLKPSTKVGEVEKPPVVLTTNEQRGDAI